MFFRTPRRPPSTTAEPTPAPASPATDRRAGLVEAAPDASARAAIEPRPSTLASNADFTWRKRIHERLLDTIDLRRRDLNRMSDGELRSETTALVREIIAAEATLPPALDREQLCREVLDEAISRLARLRA